MTDPGTHAAPRPAPDTKERILDAAESLFANLGFTATSLRAITADAGVNLAAVNYHFGGKEKLFEAVLSRALGPLNAERLRMLDALEAGGATPPVRDVLRAFLEPPLRLEHADAERTPTFMRLLGHATGDPNPMVRDIVIGQFMEVFERFRRALACAQPGHPPPEIVWSMLFTVGMMAHTLMMSKDLPRFAPELRISDIDGLVERMVTFATAGTVSLGDQPITPAAPDDTATHDESGDAS